MSDEALDFTTYVRRTPIEQEWLTALLRGCWQQGLAFSRDLPTAATWEEALKEPIAQLFSDPQTLPEVITRIVAKNRGGISVCDRWLSLILEVDPNYFEENTSSRREMPFRGTHPPYGMVSIGTNFSRYQVGEYDIDFETIDDWRDSPLLTLHQQVMLSLCHWGRVLCSLVGPEYGFLVNPAVVEDELPEVRDETIPALLAQGILPPLEELLPRPAYAIYADARLVQPHHITTWLAQEETTVQRVGNGYFVTSLPGLYRYGNNVGIAYLRYARQARKLQHPQQALQLLQRAESIFTTLADEQGLDTTRILKL